MGRWFALITMVSLLALAMCGCSRQAPTQPSAAPTAGQPAGPQATAAQVSSELSGDVVDGVRVIKVKAHQWAFEPNRIMVKKGEKVRIIARSSDVTHGFGLPDFNIDEQLPPNKDVTVEFTPDRAGQFEWRCTVYCGAGHKNMRGMLVVTE